MRRTPSASVRPRPAQRVVRILSFFLAWVALGRVGSFDLLVGVGASVIAAELSLRLIPPAARPLRPLALARLAWHIVSRSVVGGIDLARRVFHPSLPLACGVLAVDCGLPDGLARQAFAATASLQPGTLPVGEEDEALLLHALDLDGAVLEALDVDLMVFLDAWGAAPPVAGEEAQRE